MLSRVVLSLLVSLWKNLLKSNDSHTEATCISSTADAGGNNNLVLPKRQDVSELGSVSNRHGPKPGSHEAEALTKLKAEAISHLVLKTESETLCTNPSYLMAYTVMIGCKVEALVNQEDEAETFENHVAEARLSKI